jgi:hypothetical protein
MAMCFYRKYFMIPTHPHHQIIIVTTARYLRYDIDCQMRPLVTQQALNIESHMILEMALIWQSHRAVISSASWYPAKSHNITTKSNFKLARMDSAFQYLWHIVILCNFSPSGAQTRHLNSSVSCWAHQIKL